VVAFLRSRIGDAEAHLVQAPTMKAPIQEHDWSIVEEWFKQRCVGTGIHCYQHVERIAINKTIDDIVEQAAIELGMAAGKALSELGDVI
jgi:hypothetical protein